MIKKRKFDLLFENIMSNINNSIIDKLKLICPECKYIISTDEFIIESDNIILQVSPDEEYGINKYRIGIYDKQYSIGISELIDNNISLEQLKQIISDLFNSFFKKYNNNETNIDILKLKEKLTLF